MQIDVLNEISIVAAMRATTALSKFLEIPFVVDMNPIEIKNINEIDSFDDHVASESKTVNLYIPILFGNNMSGASYFVFTPKDALLLCDILLNKEEGTTQQFNEIEKSALLEVANIVIGNFLTFFANSLQMNFIMHCSGEFYYSLFSLLVEQQLPMLAKNIEKYVVKLCFNFRFNCMKGYVVIIFDKDKIDALLESTLTTVNA